MVKGRCSVVKGRCSVVKGRCSVVKVSCSAVKGILSSQANESSSEFLLSADAHDVTTVLRGLRPQMGRRVATQEQEQSCQGLLPTLAKVRCSRPFTTVWTLMGLTQPNLVTSPLTTMVSCSCSVATTSSSCET